MTKTNSAGTRFRAAVKAEKPLQVIGAINAYHARLAQRTGYKAIYLSGGGVAAGSLGLPDLGISTLDDVLERVEARSSPNCRLAGPWYQFVGRAQGVEARGCGAMAADWVEEGL